MQTDAIKLSIQWNRLIAIVDEAANGLVRCCYSQTVREYHDYCTGIFDRDGVMLAHSTRTTCGFIGIIAAVMKHFVEIFGVDIKPGDVYMTNDPWMASGHLLDITLARPVFHENELVGFALCIVHHTDIGGRMADIESRDIFEEGLQIPPMKWFDGDRENASVLQFIKANVRTPDKVEGDLRAQLSALHICERGLQKMLDDYPGTSVKQVADEITSRSERSMRQAMKALPPGIYRHSVLLPAIGRQTQPIPMQLAVRIEPERIVLDFTGSSGEVAAAINSPIYYSKGYAYYALKLLLDPHVPNNDGCVRPFDFVAEPGSVLNCRRPAPTWAKSIISHYLPEMVFHALRDVLPDRLIADCGSTPLSAVFTRGTRYDGSDFIALQSDKGGYGASARADGKACVSYPYNTANVPIEITENETALVYLRKEMACDSGGPGLWRGGPGQIVEFKIADASIAPRGPVAVIPRGSQRSEDSVLPVRGVRGGKSGRGTDLMLNGEPIAHGANYPLMPGDVISLALPGGGGFGDPLTRDPERVRADVAAGLVSIEAAHTDYRVAIDPVTHAVDNSETTRLRASAFTQPMRSSHLTGNSSLHPRQAVRDAPQETA